MLETRFWQMRLNYAPQMCHYCASCAQISAQILAWTINLGPYGLCLGLYKYRTVSHCFATEVSVIMLPNPTIYPTIHCCTNKCIPNAKWLCLQLSEFDMNHSQYLLLTHFCYPVTPWQSSQLSCEKLLKYFLSWISMDFNNILTHIYDKFARNNLSTPCIH